jgi:hypothetical protein
VDQLLGLDIGQSERGSGCVDLVGFLGVDDAGGAVREKAVGEVWFSDSAVALMPRATAKPTSLP